MLQMGVQDINLATLWRQRMSRLAFVLCTGQSHLLAFDWHRILRAHLGLEVYALEQGLGTVWATATPNSKTTNRTSRIVCLRFKEKFCGCATVIQVLVAAILRSVR